MVVIHCYSRIDRIYYLDVAPSGRPALMLAVPEAAMTEQADPNQLMDLLADQDVPIDQPTAERLKDEASHLGLHT